VPDNIAGIFLCNFGRFSPHAERTGGAACKKTRFFNYLSHLSKSPNSVKSVEKVDRF
jgi:hypothetical protein